MLVWGRVKYKDFWGPWGHWEAKGHQSWLRPLGSQFKFGFKIQVESKFIHRFLCLACFYGEITSEILGTVQPTFSFGSVPNGYVEHHRFWVKGYMRFSVFQEWRDELTCTTTNITNYYDVKPRALSESPSVFFFRVSTRYRRYHPFPMSSSFRIQVVSASATSWRSSSPLRPAVVGTCGNHPSIPRGAVTRCPRPQRPEVKQKQLGRWTWQGRMVISETSDGVWWVFDLCRMDGDVGGVPEIRAGRQSDDISWGKAPLQSWDDPNGYGSIPIFILFLGGWTSITAKWSSDSSEFIRSHELTGTMAIWWIPSPHSWRNPTLCRWASRDHRNQQRSQFIPAGFLMKKVRTCTCCR